MTLREAIQLIPFRPKLVNPGPRILEQLELARDRRSFLLSDLKVPTEGICLWCNVGKLPTKRHKYCSKDCAHSAWTYCNPQNNEFKGYVLCELQQGACAICGLDHSEFIIKRILENKEMAEERVADGFTGWKNWSYLLVMNNTGDVLQVDHRLAIFKGGSGIGWDNIQVVCTSCHKKKTIEERRG